MRNPSSIRKRACNGCKAALGYLPDGFFDVQASRTELVNVSGDGPATHVGTWLVETRLGKESFSLKQYSTIPAPRSARLWR